jgi:outer membrane immunogenic protein
MPTKAPVSAPLLAPLAAPSWTGFYAGANVGYGWGDNAATVTANDPATRFFSGVVDSGSIHPPRFDTNGVFGGLQVGYNQQFAVNWLAGIEADIQWSNIKGSSYGAFSDFPLSLTSNANEHVHWFGTVRGRLGYLVTPNWVVYGTGGYAYGRVESQASLNNISVDPHSWIASGITFTCPASAACAAGSRTDIRSGWTAGGGFEYMLTGDTLFARPVTLKLEYLYVNLGSDHLLVPSVNNPTAASFTAHFGDVALHTVRGGVNVKF